jgi:hypothetical protein
VVLCESVGENIHDITCSNNQVLWDDLGTPPHMTSCSKYKIKVYSVKEEGRNIYWG